MCACVCVVVGEIRPGDDFAEPTDAWSRARSIWNRSWNAPLHSLFFAPSITTTPSAGCSSSAAASLCCSAPDVSGISNDGRQQDDDFWTTHSTGQLDCTEITQYVMPSRSHRISIEYNEIQDYNIIQCSANVGTAFFWFSAFLAGSMVKPFARNILFHP